MPHAMFIQHPTESTEWLFLGFTEHDEMVVEHQEVAEEENKPFVSVFIPSVDEVVSGG